MLKKLTVVNVAYPFAEINEDAIGGAERVVYELDRSLVRAGHRSLVLGHARSSISGELLGVEVPDTPITPALRARITAEYRARLSSLRREEQVDVLHFHGVDCADYLPVESSPPRIVTLHLASDCYSPRLFDSCGVVFTCVSQAQLSALAHVVRDPLLIENGVDLEHYRPGAAKAGTYALCLGRICPEKGFDVALRAAKRAGLPLRLAGRVFPYAEHERYFEEQIAPELDEARTFLGPVRGEAKRRLLREAACLVVPSRVDETSSLVVMEALAVGTPAIVSERGALPSLIEPGVTGFVATSEQDLTDALGRSGTLDRGACRASAEARFDLKRSIAAYLALYTRAIG